MNSREDDRVPQEKVWFKSDHGRQAPCDLCGRIGRVILGWPSLGEDSPILARCREHEPEDDYT